MNGDVESLFLFSLHIYILCKSAILLMKYRKMIYEDFEGENLHPEMKFIIYLAF